jgi:DNA-binding IclR family transcriptional regulator
MDRLASNDAGPLREPISTNNRKYSAPAAACAADVLLALARADGPLSVPQLSQLTDYTKSLVYRAISELEERKLVAKGAGGSFRLGLAVVELGGAFSASVPLMSSVRSILRDVADQTRETVNLGTLQGNRVLYVMREEGEHSIVALSHVGKLLPASATGQGKALLARMSDAEISATLGGGPLPALTSKSITSVDILLHELAAVRARGYAEEHGEAVVGRGCVAVSLAVEHELLRTLAISISFAEDRFSELRDTAVEALFRARETIVQHANDRVAIGQPAEAGEFFPALHGSQ